jgi:hypothetical protein
MESEDWTAFSAATARHLPPHGPPLRHSAGRDSAKGKWKIMTQFTKASARRLSKSEFTTQFGRSFDFFPLVPGRIAEAEPEIHFVQRHILAWSAQASIPRSVRAHA